MPFLTVAAAKQLATLQCVLSNAASQNAEDLLMLPTLLGATHGRNGTFVEIGALDGVTFSNTLLLERCFGWTGVLIEANLHNFKKLAASGRVARTVYSAVCADSSVDRAVPILSRPGGVAGDPAQMAGLFKRSFHSDTNLTDVVHVPCRSLDTLIATNGLTGGIDLLSLDVEGAEETVIRTTDARRYSTVVVEKDGFDRRKELRVQRRLIDAGLRLAKAVAPARSSVWTKPGVEAVRPSWASVLAPLQVVPGQCTPGGCHGHVQRRARHPARNGGGTVDVGSCVEQCVAHCGSRCRFLTLRIASQECAWSERCAGLLESDAEREAAQWLTPPKWGARKWSREHWSLAVTQLTSGQG